MEYIGRDNDIANVACQMMGWDDHNDFIIDVGENVFNLWYPLSQHKYAHVDGMETTINVICVVDNRMYDGECLAVVTSYGVYVDVNAIT
jgi:hypothetical protein